MEDFAFHLQNLNIGERGTTGVIWYLHTQSRISQFYLVEATFLGADDPASNLLF